MRPPRALAGLLAIGLLLLTMSAALAGNNTNTVSDTDSTQTWSQTFLASDLTGLDVRTIDSVTVVADALTVTVADRAKNVTSATDLWDVNLAISNLSENCTPSSTCVGGGAALVLAKDHAVVAPAATVTTGAVPLVGAVTNGANVSAGAGGALATPQTLFSGDGYNATGTAIGLYTQASTLSYDWDSAMAAASVANPGDYLGKTFDSTVTVTLVE